MEELIGTEKQVKWAKDIRKNIYNNIDKTRDRLQPHLTEEEYGLLVLLLDNYYETLAIKLEMNMNQAKFWIDQRYSQGEDGFGGLSYFDDVDRDSHSALFLFEMSKPIYDRKHEISINKENPYKMDEKYEGFYQKIIGLTKKIAFLTTSNISIRRSSIDVPIEILFNTIHEQKLEEIKKEDSVEKVLYVTDVWKYMDSKEVTIEGKTVLMVKWQSSIWNSRDYSYTTRGRKGEVNAEFIFYYDPKGDFEYVLSCPVIKEGDIKIHHSGEVFERNAIVRIPMGDKCELIANPDVLTSKVLRHCLLKLHGPNGEKLFTKYVVPSLDKFLRYD